MISQSITDHLPAGEPLPIPAGFRAAGVRAGIKESGAPDLAVLVADGDCAAAGVFTTNRIAAAPVQWDRALLPSTKARAVVVNSGNANAATGAQGLADARRTATRAAEVIGCEPGQVLVASTGVIGHQLPMEKVEAGLARALDAAAAGEGAFRAAAGAILTTDTHPKLVARSVEVAGAAVNLLGMAKGAAMIGPNMATMLGFLLTDARVGPADLQAILRDAVDDSFNCISVEGHMSTNDTVLLLASGGVDRPALNGKDLDVFKHLVRDCCADLARMIPEDGEGATHLITIEVEGCADVAEARAIARAVADSPLVKTAIHGADPNWGRIVSAAGYAGVPFEESELSLWLDGVPLYRGGVPLPFDDAAVSGRLRSERDVQIRLALGRGPAKARFWTCDLTAEYVRLNADYTT
ncbi:MAG TPA: bifunctional glutamate N-acetyltransferase/amino-acid acetyltransferase ArgJ [Isosphaeraceae bacterium]|jgi:glutamate N-acetyltransferase/amino-acid N-acetyltransferase|nr:bifunctional glutamate N-acetyltransferase/amino-acid acetyltransferase ArgJ [Isosphaeraceae bacterium]